MHGSKLQLTLETHMSWHEIFFFFGSKRNPEKFSKNLEYWKIQFSIGTLWYRKNILCKDCKYLQPNAIQKITDLSGFGFKLPKFLMTGIREMLWLHLALVQEMACHLGKYYAKPCILCLIIAPRVGWHLVWAFTNMMSYAAAVLK